MRVFCEMKIILFLKQTKRQKQFLLNFQVTPNKIEIKIDFF